MTTRTELEAAVARAEGALDDALYDLHTDREYIAAHFDPAQTRSGTHAQVIYLKPIEDVVVFRRTPAVPVSGFEFRVKDDLRTHKVIWGSSWDGTICELDDEPLDDALKPLTIDAEDELMDDGVPLLTRIALALLDE